VELGEDSDDVLLEDVEDGEDWLDVDELLGEDVED